jgi:hypothetical protein
MDNLRKYIQNNINKPTNVIIYTNIANYTDKISFITDLSDIVIAKKGIILSFNVVNVLNPFGIPRTPSLYIHYTHNQTIDGSTIAFKIRNSRLTSYPYFESNHSSEESQFLLISNTSLADITTYKKMIQYSHSVAKECHQRVLVIGIDAELAENDLEIVKDILTQFVIINVKFYWCIIGNRTNLKLFEAKSMAKCMRFQSIDWDIIFPNNNFGTTPCYISLLADAYTLVEIPHNTFSLRKINNDEIVFNLPQMS